MSGGSQAGLTGGRAGRTDGKLVSAAGGGGRMVCTLVVLEEEEEVPHQRIRIRQLLLESRRLHTRTRGRVRLRFMIDFFYFSQALPHISLLRNHHNHRQNHLHIRNLHNEQCSG